MASVQNKTVLIVDEEPEFQRTLGRVLGQEGYDLLLANPGKDALTAVAVKRPDLIVLELGCPGSSALQFLTALRSAPGWSDIPVLLLSTHERNPDMAQAMQLGVRDSLIVTHFSTRHLRSRVRQSLGVAAGVSANMN